MHAHTHYVHTQKHRVTLAGAAGAEPVPRLHQSQFLGRVLTRDVGSYSTALTGGASRPVEVQSLVIHAVMSAPDLPMGIIQV